MKPVPVDGRSLISKFFPGTGKSYDVVARRASLGLDARWKRRALAHMPRSSSSILELAAGTGILTSMLLDQYPSARVTAVDVTEDYVAVAKAKLAARGDGHRVTFLHGNAESAEFEGPFDSCVSSYIPKYCDLDALARNVDRALTPGATVVFHDFNHPRGGFPRLVWRAWFGVLHLVAPTIWPEWAPTFDRDLMSLIKTSDWPKRSRAAFAALGYDVGREHLTGHAATIVWARKPR